MTPRPFTVFVLFALMLALAAPEAFAQRERGRGAQAREAQRPPTRMTPEDRQQLRRDLREAHRGARQAPHRLSLEERARMRRDMNEANRRLQRR